MVDGDPYSGEAPGFAWEYNDSDEGGLNALSLDGKTRMDTWSTVRNLLKYEGIPARLKDKRIIELGSGRCTLFRDYCIDSQAKEYIGVDLFEDPPFDQTKIGNTNVRYIKQDALQFLKSQAPDSAIVAQAMLFCRENIRTYKTLEPKKIIKAVCLAVHRVVASGEFLISWNASPDFREELIAAGFQENDTELVYTKAA
ncbi:hypothetical protein ACFL3C_02630 [Patescibacteria group bacterium]